MKIGCITSMCSCIDIVVVSSCIAPLEIFLLHHNDFQPWHNRNMPSSLSMFLRLDYLQENHLLDHRLNDLDLTRTMVERLRSYQLNFFLNFLVLKKAKSVLIGLVRSVWSVILEERPKLVRDGRTGFYFRSLTWPKNESKILTNIKTIFYSDRKPWKKVSYRWKW